MWPGYLQVGGMEISNAGRVETYVGKAPWFKPLYGATDLYVALDDDPYTTPEADDAPWTDDMEPWSDRFFGFYLLDVTGVEDSSRSVTFTESTGDGGRPSRVRHTSKTIVFNGVLMGRDEQATEYGMRWLRNALLASPCGQADGTTTCAGVSMCYFAAEPCTDPSAVCWDTSVPPTITCDDSVLATGRTLRKFAVTTGPTVTAKHTTIDGSEVWTVTFTGVAGVPWEYGYERCIVERFMDPLVTNPFCDGINGSFDSDGYLFDDTDIPCATTTWAPVYDPNCPALVPPPAPPTVDIACADTPTEWTRRQFTIPGDHIPLWTDMVPLLTLTTAGTAVNNVRVRFYTDPYETGNPAEDPCAFCGDFLITYIPPNTVLQLDGASETITATSQNTAPRNANSVVFGSDGKPFEWPLLSCGVGYIVTIDLPSDATVTPIVDFALTPRAA